MKDIEVEDLLKRFMEGDTSVEEETALADFFREASDEDRPDCISEEDWEAYREMFRMFEEGNIDRGRDAHAPRGIRSGSVSSGLRIYIAAAAAMAAFFVLVFMLNVGGEQGEQMIAEVGAVDTIKAMTVHIDTLRDKPSIDKMRDEPSIDKLRDGNVEIPPTPSQKVKPKKQQKLPYTPSVPRHLIAQAAKPNGISADSMAVALEEAERLINAMTVYQELRISEICNVEYEEVY